VPEEVGFIITVATITAGLVGWEYRKQMSLKRQVDGLERKMETLHNEHQTLLDGQNKEHSELLRGVTTALKDLHGGIGELTHYIRWLGKQQTGREPPPPLGSTLK